MVESFSEVAIVKLPRRPVGTDARTCCRSKHGAHQLVIAFRRPQVAGDAVGIPWCGYESSLEHQSTRYGKGYRRYCGDEGRRSTGRVMLCHQRDNQWHSRFRPTVVAAPSPSFCCLHRSRAWTTSASDPIFTKQRAQQKNINYTPPPQGIQDTNPRHLLTLGRQRCPSTPPIQTVLAMAACVFAHPPRRWAPRLLSRQSGQSG